MASAETRQGRESVHHLDLDAAIKVVFGDHADGQMVERYRHEFELEQRKGNGISAGKFVRFKKNYLDFIASARRWGFHKKEMVDKQFAAYQSAKTIDATMTIDEFFETRRKAVLKNGPHNDALKTRVAQLSGSETLREMFAFYADRMTAMARRASMEEFESRVHAFFEQNSKNGGLTLADFEEFLKI